MSINRNTLVSIEYILWLEKDEEGILSKLAFWKDDAEKAPEEYYYIKLISDAEATKIIILDAEETRTSSDTAKRLLACEMNVIAYDPSLQISKGKNVTLLSWPEQIVQCDFLVFISKIMLVDFSPVQGAESNTRNTC